MRKTELAIACLMLGALTGADVMAQTKWEWWTDQKSSPRNVYDPATVETIKGTVVGVDSIPPREGGGDAVQLRVKTATEMIAVYLGPSWYLERQDPKIGPKDEIEIKGSRTKFRGKPVVTAAEVRKGKAVLMLRDVNGTPAWTGLRKESEP